MTIYTNTVVSAVATSSGSNPVEIQYRWFLNGDMVATTPTYAVPIDAAGKSLRVTVTVTNPCGTDTKTSSTATIMPGYPSLLFYDTFTAADGTLLENHISDSGHPWFRAPEAAANSQSPNATGIVIASNTAEATLGSGGFGVSDPVISSSVACMEVKIIKLKEPSTQDVFVDFGFYCNNLTASVQGGFTIGTLSTVGQTEVTVSDYTTSYYPFGANIPITFNVGSSITAKLNVTATGSVLSINGTPIFTTAETFNTTGTRVYIQLNTQNSESSPCFAIDYIKVAASSF